LNRADITFRSFLDDFNRMYKAHSIDIFNHDKIDAMEDLRQKYAKYLDWEIIIESADLMHYLLITDPHLLKIHWLLKSFGNVLTVEQELIRKKEAHLQFMLSQSSSDLKTIFDHGSHPEIIATFIEILLMKIKASGSLDSACEYLNTLGFDEMEVTIRGGIPYHAKEILASHCSIKIADMLFPENINLRAGHNETIPGQGNQNWLLFLKSLQDFTIATKDASKKKLTSFLSNDYLAHDELLSSPHDKLYNILRVSFYYRSAISTMNF
jgi:hypothetical protein